jgi:hypothetical protein
MKIPNPFAQIGDPDLCMDVDGCTLTSVVVMDREVLLTLTGGFGSWKDNDSTTVVDPGSDDAYRYQYTFSASRWPEDLFQGMLDTLEEWRAASVPLRLLGAPGKISILMLDEDNMLALARTPDKIT